MIKKHMSLILAVFMMMQVFSLTVSADAVNLASDVAALTRESLLKVALGDDDLLVDNLNLPTQGANGSIIIWSSSPAGIIAANGKVNRPEADTEVTLTATLTNGGETDTKDFIFTVAGRESRAYGLPLPIDTIYYEDFDDGVLDSRIVMNPGAGSVTEENGVLRFYKGAASGTTGSDVYLKNDQSGVTGQLVTEFILKRPSNGNTFSAQIIGDGGIYAIVNWWDPGNNILNLEYAEIIGGERKDHIVSLNNFDASNTLKVTAYFDTAEKTYTLWLNNQYAASGYSCGATSVTRIYFYNGSSVLDVSLDDFHCYTADYVLSDEICVEADYNSLSQSSFFKAPLVGTYLIDTLNLPTEGVEGSAISWSSSHPDVIAEDGWLTRAMSDTVVTMTATVTKGAASKTKDFTFTVPGRTTAVNDLPLMSDMKFYDSFDDNTPGDRISLTPGNGTAAESGGVLQVAKPDSAGMTRADIYLNEDRSIATGQFVTEFILTRKTQTTSSVILSGENVGMGGIAFLMNWWDSGNNIVNLQYANSANGGRDDHLIKLTDIDGTTRLKVTLYIDTVANRVSVWLNNQFAGNGYLCGAKGVSNVGVYNDTTAFDCALDDFRYYTASLPGDAAQRVEEAMAAITEASLLKADLTSGGLLLDSLQLKKTSENGCNISWTSDKPDIIDSDGNLTRPKESETVILTASVNYMGEGTQTKSFTFNVAGLGAEPEGMPKLTGLAYSDNFDDGIADERHIVLSDGSGMSREQDGVLSLIKPTGAGTTAAAVYPEEDRSSFSGRVVAEFIMTRKTNTVFSAQITSDAGIFLIVDWWPTSTGINVQYADVKNGDYTNHFFSTAAFNAENRLKVTLYVSDTEGSFSLWLNNQLAVESGYSYAAKVINRVYFYNGSSVCNAAVEDFRLYYAQEEDSDAVDKDLAVLDSFFIPGELTDGVLYKSVSLPTEGVHGSQITWNSSDTSLLENDGTVNRPSESAYATDPSVMITATVTSGGVTKTRDFTFVILRTGSGDRRIAEMDAAELTLSALLEKPEQIEGYITGDLILPVVGQFGSTIVWESSIPTLISHDGKIVYFPTTANESPEVILTASVTFGTVTVTREISVRVLPQEADTLKKDLPEVYETFQFDDFKNDNNAVKYGWSLRPYGEGVAGVVDGKMQISRRMNQGASYITHAEIFAHESTQAQEGLVAFDFTWDKDKTGVGYFQAQTGAGILTQIDWNADRSLTVSYADSLGGGNKSIVTKPYAGEVRVTGRIDSDNGVFILWLNEEVVIQDKYPASGSEAKLWRFFFGIAGENFIDMYVDNLHCYYARPFLFEQPYMDAKKMTEEQLLTKDFAMPQTIDADLNLVTEGYYGSVISWTSSDPDIIDPVTGAVHRPVDTQEKPFVTVTATITAGGYVATKSFSYYVLPTFTSDSQFVQADIDYLNFENYNIFSFDDSSLDSVRYSMQLPSKLAYGSKIMWSTSNAAAVTSSGRVIRPRWDQAAGHATLVATVSYGSSVMTKNFDITVLPDEELKDPGYMPDEEFFGEWNGSSWVQTGKFDYASNPGMADIEAAAKAGDYEAAKAALLAYLRSRPNSVINTNSTPRNTAYVDNLALNSVWHYSGDRWFMGYTTVRNHEYEQIEIPLQSTSTIGAKASFNIEAKYNEASSLSIASKEHPNPAFRPKLRVISNGQTYTYDAIADATSRAGQYDFTNYGMEETMKVKMFGELQGDETWIGSVMFDTNGVPSGVESATLLLTVKLDEDFVESKDILIYEEPNVGWTDADLTYSRTSKFYYNVNGIPGDMDWLRTASLKYADSEYQQTHRFQNFSEILTEYEYTGNEKYAYKLLYTMMDYIIDSQFTMSLSEYWNYNGRYLWSDYWELDIQNGGNTKRRGGMPQLLTTSFRLTCWIPLYERLLNSPYMTPDVCTTVLKNLWDCSYEGNRYLVDYALKQAPTAHNQWVIEANNITKVALCFPEFSAGESWISNMQNVLEHVKLGGYSQDGGYGEAVQGYSELVLNEYLNYVIMMHKAGRKLPEDFEDFLYNATIYCMMINTDSAGVAMSWGDAGWYVSLDRRMPLYEQLNPEPNYMFISTRGAEGVEPDWTSIHFPSVRVTVMQSDWGKSALHAFIDNNGIGGHGHPDDNALRVTAYGEYLLIDPGVFSYDNTIYRRYGTSTLGHNTVEVDGKTQNYANDGMFVVEDNDLPGWTDEWSTNRQFDVLSQTSESYSDVNHRRTITFLKSGFWIVSDLMQPKDDNPHDYKQLWHFMPKSNLSLNTAQGTMGTNQNGANITLSSPDGVVTSSPAYDEQNPTMEMGWFSRRWGTADYAPYGYYAKNDVVGNTGFDTVLFPYTTKGQGSATTEDIDLGVPVDVATAMKMTTSMNSQVSETSYLLEYEPTAGKTRTFGDFAGDGMVNVVRTDTDGTIQELILNKGTVLKRSDGNILLDTNEVLANVGLEIRGTTAIITTGSSQATGDVTIRPEDISFYASGTVDNVLVNGVYYTFTQDADGIVHVGNDTTDENVNNGSGNNHGGIVTDDNPGGGNQGGGNQGGGNQGGNITPPVTPDDSFADIAGHWAQQSIERMAKQGIVQGENGYFRPDTSITRAELVTMVIRALGIEAEDTDSGFIDVASDSWYAPYIKAALINGIISQDTAFRPNDLVTREEMAKILSGADSISKGKDLTLPDGGALSYQDVDSIVAWALPYVSYATENGLMRGMEDNSFLPKSNATRAQAVTVLDRIFTQT